MRHAVHQPAQLLSRALPLHVGGAELLADSSGAVFWADCDTLLVADLHLEKGAAYAGRGVFLPPYDTRDALARLSPVLAHYDPARVIILGDSFHSTAAADGMASTNLDVLASLQRGREWVWLLGNHDPVIPKRIGGDVCRSIVVRGITLRHEPEDGDSICEIAGHLHPVARLSLRGDTVRRRCFIGNRRRLVVPAFGALAGGLNVCDPVFASLFGPSLDLHEVAVHMLGKSGLFQVSTRSLIAD